MAPKRSKVFSTALCAVVDREFVACAGQIGCHFGTHVAETDESDFHSKLSIVQRVRCLNGSSGK